VRSVVIAFFVISFACGCATTPSGSSPYAGQQSREIKSLSEGEVQGYLAGKGMGFAKPAELNGYPGPAHVLEMGERIGLTADQRRRTQAIFELMQANAAALGRQLVDEERALDQLFATQAVTSTSLAATLDRIAALQAKIRAAHLDAHLAQARVLTSAQVQDYVRLRGYDEHRH
jgi:Spy/CpxP family protein refolding chaperone